MLCPEIWKIPNFYGNGLTRYPGDFQSSFAGVIPDNKLVAFNWGVHVIDETKRLLSFEELPESAEEVYLRVSIAVEVWERKIVQATIPGTNIILGELDIRYAPALTPFQIKVNSDHLALIKRKGIQLALILGESSLWIFQDAANMPDSFKPHLIVANGEDDQLKQFFDSFQSLDSIQTFGWREGCVLDGLYQRYKKKGQEQALEAVKAHLKMYIPEEDLIHLNAWNKERGNHLDTIEATLPFASLIKIEPHHPVLRHVEDFWKAKRRTSGIVTSGSTITAEGCYTVGYPMAVMSVYQQREDMAKWAVQQISERHVLSNGDDFYLRYNPDNEQHYMKNWARGSAWYLLGTARVLETLKDRAEKEVLLEKFKQDIEKAIAFQQPDGMWNCYLHEESVPTDTSGSSGIATAIAVGVNCGILSPSYLSVSRSTAKTLKSYLTVDGYLSGVAQDNRGGEELQKGDYRVIAQMAMGLMAQLYAEL